MEIFERQPKETSMAYESARAYFEMGADRSIALVAQKFTKSTRLLKRWSVAWSWVARAAAWDEQRQKMVDAAVAAAISETAVKVAAEWETRDRQLRQLQYDLTQRTIAKMDKMLEFPLATVTTETLCQEGVKRHAVRKMKGDPSKPPCRGRLQTAGSCFGQKPRW